MTRKVTLENVQVGNRGELTAKVLDKDGVEEKEFVAMHDEMNRHFDNDQMATIVPYHPHVGQVCVGKVGSVWHRVRVDGVMSLKCGLHASCFLIDEGKHFNIPVPCLRQIPPRFAKLPHQIKQLSLFGIKPLSLQISPEDLMVYERSVIRWDSSAVVFMSEHIKAAKAVKVKIVTQHPDSIYPVIMYLYTRNGNRVCLNDALVDQRFAVNQDHTDIPTLPVQKSRKQPEGLASLRMLKIQSEKTVEHHARSDVEHADPKPMLLDRDCITDTEAVSALSHRFQFRNVNQSNRAPYQSSQSDIEVPMYSSQSNSSAPCDQSRAVSPASSQLDQHTCDGRKLTEYDSLEEFSHNNMADSARLYSNHTDIYNPSEMSVCDLVNSKDDDIHPTRNLQYQSSCQPSHSEWHYQQKTPFSSNQNDPTQVQRSSSIGQCTQMENLTPKGVTGNRLSLSPSVGNSTFSKTSPSAGRGVLSLGRGALLKSLSPNNSSLMLSNSLSNQRKDYDNAIINKSMQQEPILNLLSSKPKPSTIKSVHDQSDTSAFYQDNVNICENPIKEQPSHATSDLIRNRLRSSLSYESGNESSASYLSAVTASATGQMHAFTKSRRPRTDCQSSDGGLSTFISGNESTDSHFPAKSLLEVVKEKSPKTSPVKTTKYYQSSSSETDSSSILVKKVMAAREKVEANAQIKSRQSIVRGKEPEIPSVFSQGGSPTDRKTEMLGKFSGERLMKELSSNLSGASQSGQAADTTTAERTTKSEMPGMFGRIDNVVVHGKALKNPVYNIERFPFIKEVFKHWETNKFVSPKLIQSYGWPAVMSGRHIIAISPGGSGKTLTYLYALITYLSGSNMYRELPTGMGPLVIVMSKSWRRAELVYHTASQLVNGRKTRILLVYGGGFEENRAFELINGCDILLTTPPCLKRLLEKGYTDLRRLCHLVIDDCDQTLDTFHVEINYIKSEYSLVIQNEIKQLECPRQILVFGSQWNEVNSQFTENVLDEPVLIITSPFEAAIYGKVRQIPHHCKKARRMNEVEGLLENVDTGHKTIIFSSNKEDVKFLIKSLRAYSYNAIYVTEDMELYDVKTVADDWAHGAGLLVCCDKHVMDMNIVDASFVIHFDLPDSKTKFGNRMSCMRQNFYNFASTHKKKIIEPVSHLLITETCGKQVRTIQELLKRSKVEIPKQLKAFLAGMVEQREQDENKELCYQLLAYGTCRDKWRCGCRHIVIPEIDTSPETEWLPSEGHVKVLVTHVNENDASHFYVRLLSVKLEDETVSQPALIYAKLMLDLELWYKKLENQKRHTAPFAGELCGYQDRGVFYRVQILDIPNMNTHGKGTGSIEVSVKFIDIGRDMKIDVNKLYELPIHMKNVPFQAVEVFVCRVKPVDKDPEWTTKASAYINELLYGKELEGKIVLRLGGILWLDPLVERVYLGEARAIINRSYVHVELIRNGFANENPTHLEKLYRLCEGKVILPRLLLVKTKMSQILQTDTLPLCRQYHDIYISSVTSPDIFFIQRKEKHSELDDLMKDIDDYVHALEEDDGLKEMEAGQYCLAQYESFDKKWYRARVMVVFENSYEIFFADYGDLDTVPKEKVKEFPADKFFDLPLQAIECKLSDICTDSAQEKKSGDALWDLSHFVNGDLKSLVGTVKSQIDAEFTGRHRFVVDLFDTNGSDDLNIAQELVYRRLAFKSQGSHFEDLFTKPAGVRRKIYSSPFDKIHDLIAIIYWESDCSKAFDTAKQVLDLIKNSVSRSADSRHSSMISALQNLIKLIGRIQQFSIEAVIQDCILELLYTGDKMCEEFLQSHGLSNVIRCLEMENNTSMQCQAAEFVSRLCTTSTKIRIEVQTVWTNILSTLIELIEYSQCEEIKGSVCKAFAALCSGSDSVFQELMKKSVCTKLKKLLLESSDHEVQESVILLLSALADQDGSHSDLKRESLIEAIVKNLKSTICDKCIQHSVEFCAHYASTRRKHKTHLLELEMVPGLKRILELDVQTTTKQQCKDLLSSLVVKFPSEPVSGVPYITERKVANTNKEVLPNVHWCQTTFVVQLSVKIPECTCSPDSFTFNEQTVHFRDTVNGVRYAFKLDLFDRITPAKCKVATKPHEVLVSLYKQVKGRWTRLQSGKQKPSWIFVDHERFVDSSCDSDTYDETRPFVFKKKKKTKKLPTDKSSASAYRVLSSDTETDNSLNYFDDPHERDEFDIFA